MKPKVYDLQVLFLDGTTQVVDEVESTELLQDTLYVELTTGQFVVSMNVVKSYILREVKKDETK